MLYTRRLTLLASMAMIALLPSCSLFQKILANAQPEFKINAFTVKDLSLESITFHIDAELLNHLPVPLPQSLLKLDVKINDQPLTKMQSGPISVKAGASTPVPLDLTLKYADLYRIVKSMSLVESFKVGFQGAADFPVTLPGMPEKISVPFNVEKTVPSFLPDVTIDSVQIRRPDLSSLVSSVFKDEIPLGMDVDLTVNNRGGAKFNFDQMGYTMMLGGSNVFKGKTTSAEAGPDGKSSKIRISTDVPLKESVKAILPLLKGSAINYEFKGTAAFTFADVDLSELKLPLNKTGSIGF